MSSPEVGYLSPAYELFVCPSATYSGAGLITPKYQLRYALTSKGILKVVGYSDVETLYYECYFSFIPRAQSYSIWITVDL